MAREEDEGEKCVLKLGKYDERRNDTEREKRVRSREIWRFREI